jgi:glucosyl-3-phosphoglycerate phosphatase
LSWAFLAYTHCMSIYVAHHGETVDAMLDRLSAPDVVMTALGENQALQAAEDLASKLVLESVARIISSPRIRTMRATTIIAEYFGLSKDDIQEDERLVERNLKTFIGQRRKRVFSLPEETLVAYGAETLEQFTARNSDAYEDARSFKGVTLLITHQGNLPPLFEAAKKSAPDILPATQALLLHE